MSRMRHVLAIVAGAMAIGAPGCAAYQQPTLMQDLSRRAAFDLACDDSSLKLQVLEESRGYFPREPLVVGARGCGSRVTYVRQSGARGGWMTASVKHAPSTCEHKR